jgi:hypothetical protein
MTTTALAPAASYLSLCSTTACQVGVLILAILLLIIITTQPVIIIITAITSGIDTSCSFSTVCFAAAAGTSAIHTGSFTVWLRLAKLFITAATGFVNTTVAACSVVMAAIDAAVDGPIISAKHVRLTLNEEAEKLGRSGCGVHRAPCLLRNKATWWLLAPCSNGRQQQKSV